MESKQKNNKTDFNFKDDTSYIKQELSSLNINNYQEDKKEFFEDLNNLSGIIKNSINEISNSKNFSNLFFDDGNFYNINQLDYKKVIDDEEFFDEETLNLYYEMEQVEKNAKNKKAKNRNYGKERNLVEKFSKNPKKNNKKENELEFEKEKLNEIMINFIKNVYQHIENELYIEIEQTNEDHKSNMDKETLFGFIKEINNEIKNNNCQTLIEVSRKSDMTFKAPYRFYLDTKVYHKIKKFHNLCTVTLRFHLLIEMVISNGDTKINFKSVIIQYLNDKKETKMKIRSDAEFWEKQKKKHKKYKFDDDNKNIFICFLINNHLGKNNIMYCSCNNDCYICKSNNKNKNKPKPFDELNKYLKKENDIKNKIHYTQLWFGKFNSYLSYDDELNRFRCSFCMDFYKNKWNLARLFCNYDYEYEQDHSCQFFLCTGCYRKKRYEDKKELCPNCGKFYVNFGRVCSTMKYYNYYKGQSLFRARKFD